MSTYDSLQQIQGLGEILSTIRLYCGLVLWSLYDRYSRIATSPIHDTRGQLARSSYYVVIFEAEDEYES